MLRDNLMVKFYTKPKIIFEKLLLQVSNKEKTFEDDKKIKILLQDNVGGIPDNILPKIFEPYYTTKHQSQGTGLGLYMTYNLIHESMNGSIEANNITYKTDDKEYQGVEFIITLPIS